MSPTNRNPVDSPSLSAQSLAAELEDISLSGIPDSSREDSVQRNEKGTTNVSSLATELLREVFLWSSNGWSPTRFSERSPPLSLTHTCRLWRDVAIHTPLLWNVIFLGNSTPPKLLQLWIEWASGSPLFLDLRLLLRADDDPIVSQRRQEILTILISNASLWRELNCGGIFPDPTLLSLDIEPALRFRNLRHVYWTCGDYEQSGAAARRCFETFWVMAHSIASLKQATLNRIPLAGPWNHLEVLRLLDPPFQMAIGALSQCKQLRHLTWKCQTNNIPNYLAPVVLPSVVHLQVYLAPNIHPSSFFQCLTIPSLTHVDINVQGDHSRVLQSLRMLLIRSHANLHELQLPDIPSKDQPELIRFFQGPGLDSLGSIIIHGGCVEEDLWAFFSNADFLSSLEEIQIGVEETISCDMVESSLLQRDTSQRNKLRRVVLFMHCHCLRDNMERPGMGCTKTHSPWNTLPDRLSPIFSTQVVSWGDRGYVHY